MIVSRNRIVLISNLLIWIGLIFLAYFVENVVVFDVDFSRGFLPSEYIFLFLGIVAIFGIYFYTEKKYNSLQLNKKEIVFLCACVGLFIINVVNILTAPEVSIFEYTDPSGMIYYGEYILTWQDRLYDCLTALLTFFVPFLLIVIVPRKIFSFKQLDFVFYGCLITAGLGMLFSYIFEWQQYVNFLTHFSNMQSIEYTVKSFFYNRNTYGLFLFICLFACAYLNSKKPRWYFYLFMGIILINMFFTLAKTVLALSFLFILIYLFIQALTNFKKHRRTSITYLIILGGLILISLCITLLSVLKISPLFESLYLFMQNTIIGVGEQTIGFRINIWMNCYIILSNPISLIFGHGCGIFENQLFSMNAADPITRDATKYTHNAFIEMIGKGGFLYLAFYLAIMVYSFYAIIKIRKVNKNLSATLFLFVCLIIVAGFIECWYFYSYNTTNILITIMTFVPAFSYLYQNKHPEKKELLLKQEDLVVTKQNKASPKVILAPIMGVLGGILSYGILFILFNNNYPLWQIILAAVITIICIFIVFLSFINYHQLLTDRTYFKNNIKYMCYYLYFFALSICSFLMLSFSIMSVICLLFFGALLYISFLLYIPYLYKNVRPIIAKHDNKLSHLIIKVTKSEKLK